MGENNEVWWVAYHISLLAEKVRMSAYAEDGKVRCAEFVAEMQRLTNKLVVLTSCSG